ncbi:hypothetical protein pETSU_002 [Edwardsiella phage pEt-SU]|uniref:Uncharacterized protein n=1 Tax=Edwardsiella phage pEt-SU TaxID=2562142 RepID=A0A4D6DW71_9CAUD|nr:nuclear shell protein [Edwardsiella phage pEt-SU]QBZ70583.1 hypothetical protein pETSU_002 [Edwardsiella phage pEt-SU]
MSLDNAFDTNKENASSNNNGANVKMSNNPLFELLGSANLISSTHSVTEVTEIVKSLEETVKYLDKNTASQAQKLSLPRTIQNITSDISPQLPGITLSTVVGNTCYVMPVLFFKSGVTEVTESIFLANETMPRGVAKAATSFMTTELMERVKTSYAYRDSKQMDRVIIVSPKVVNLEANLKNALKVEDVIVDVRNELLKEWTTGLFNLVSLEAVKSGVELPSMFKDGKLFGKEDSAVARVEAVNKLVIDGKPTSYNLAVRLSTTNKNNTQNLNSNNTKTIATNYLTVSLEAMSQQQFLQARQKHPGQPVGPLVPVISTGITIPGETLNQNNSMMTALLGLYASIGANQLQFFSEAFRGKEVGNRGNIGNFNNYLTQMLGQAYGTQQAITDKNITNAAVMNQWLQNYVAPNAVYVLDLPTFSDDVSNGDFWWNIIGKQSGSTYHRTLISLLDSLSGQTFSKVIAENATKGQGRNPAKEWVPGDAILKATQMMIPTGIAQGKDGKWFNLAEVDGMFLRQENYYGSNEAAVNEYLSLLSGQSGGDWKVRQFNIYNRLNQLFSSNVIIDGWARRLLWSDAFFNTLAQAMAGAGMLSMSGSVGQAMWTMQYSNDYLTNTISAGINQSMPVGSMQFNGGYSHY